MKTRGKERGARRVLDYYRPSHFAFVPATT
jgi:hypothetical protein